jgi:hypothetical protein
LARRVTTVMPRSKSFGHQEEMVKEVIGSAIIVEAMIIYHMISPRHGCKLIDMFYSTMTI